MIADEVLESGYADSTSIQLEDTLEGVSVQAHVELRCGGSAAEHVTLSKFQEFQKYVNAPPTTTPHATDNTVVGLACALPGLPGFILHIFRKFLNFCISTMYRRYLLTNL